MSKTNKTSSDSGSAFKIDRSGTRAVDFGCRFRIGARFVSFSHPGSDSGSAVIIDRSGAGAVDFGCRFRIGHRFVSFSFQNMPFGAAHDPLVEQPSSLRPRCQKLTKGAPIQDRHSKSTVLGPEQSILDADSELELVLLVFQILDAGSDVKN